MNIQYWKCDVHVLFQYSGELGCVDPRIAATFPILGGQIGIRRNRNRKIV